MHLLTFNIADKEYALNVAHVRQVIRLREITSIPQTPDFIEGVITLRAKVIPLINLRKKFNIEKIDLNRFSRIIITQINGNYIGIIVDKVVDVVTLDTGNIEPPNEILRRAGYLIGLGKIDSRLILIMDVEKLLSGKEKINISQLHKRIELKKKE